MTAGPLPFWMNDVEFRAAVSPPGPVLVMGGPGAGKTRTLALRALNLLKGGVPPNTIFFLTIHQSQVDEVRTALTSVAESFSGTVPMEKTKRVRFGSLATLAATFLVNIREKVSDGIPEKSTIWHDYNRHFAMELYADKPLTDLGVSRAEMNDILMWDTLRRLGYPLDPEVKVPRLWREVLDVYQRMKVAHSSVDSLDYLWHYMWQLQVENTLFN